VKQEIVAYRKVIKPERSTLRLLERSRARYLPEDLEVYFDDIVDKAERIWDQLDNYKEVVEALETTNESVIAHKQNDILRILTIFSVILLPLTLVTGVFGMNFGHIPFSREYHGFVITVGIMFTGAVSLLAYFHWKRWI
jgi:magnesium transporter